MSTLFHSAWASTHRWHLVKLSLCRRRVCQVLQRSPTQWDRKCQVEAFLSLSHRSAQSPPWAWNADQQTGFCRLSTRGVGFESLAASCKVFTNLRASWAGTSVCADIGAQETSVGAADSVPLPRRWPGNRLSNEILSTQEGLRTFDAGGGRCGASTSCRCSRTKKTLRHFCGRAKKRHSSGLSAQRPPLNLQSNPRG